MSAGETLVVLGHRIVETSSVRRISSALTDAEVAHVDVWSQEILD
jgi:hypothetical protein